MKRNVFASIVFVLVAAFCFFPDFASARFLQTDPVGYEDQMNLYAYVGNDPGNAQDPSGEDTVTCTVIPEGDDAIRVVCEQDVDTSTDYTDFVFKTEKGDVLAEERLDGVQPLDENLKVVEAVFEGLGYRGAGVWSPGESYPYRGKTPSDDPSSYSNVRGRPGKRNDKTGEIWERDRLHGDHWEVYRNQKDYENGKRAYSVYDDGRLKETF